MNKISNMTNEFATLASAWETTLEAIGCSFALHGRPSPATLAATLLIEDALKHHILTTGDKRLINLLCLIRFGLTAMHGAVNEAVDKHTPLSQAGATEYLIAHASDARHLSDEYRRKIEQYRTSLEIFISMQENHHSALCERLNIGALKPK